MAYVRADGTLVVRFADGGVIEGVQAAAVRRCPAPAPAVAPSRATPPRYEARARAGDVERRPVPFFPPAA